MINSVIKAIRILSLFSAVEPRLSLTEISARLDMPKSTAHNMLNTLLSQNFIEQVEGDLYAMGTAPLVLSQSARVNVEVRDPAAPLLRKLADITHESVYLTVLDGDFALYIYAIESPRRLEARSAIGDQASLHCTSVGKSMLAHLPPERVDEIVARHGLPAYTANTITDRPALADELAVIRSQGYAVDNAEHELSTYCIGAPIFKTRGSVLGACSVSGADAAMVDGRLREIADQVVQTAQQISRHMGYIPVRVPVPAFRP